MSIELPQLPYPRDALEPHMSRETLEYHHGKHHRKYVDEANKLIKGTEYEQMGIEEIVQSASGSLFNNVAQAWNHAFFWQCLSPDASEPGPELKEALKRDFGGLKEFKQAFTQVAVKLFGSGWAWLVVNNDGELRIEQTSNADTPLRRGTPALLTCDVWEHAYYIDYRNARPDYLDAFWQLVNWSFVSKQFSHATASATA